jgi:hypothetical protein
MGKRFPTGTRLQQSTPFLHADELIDIVMHLKANLPANRDAHHGHLQMFARPNSSAKRSVFFGQTAQPEHRRLRSAIMHHPVAWLSFVQWIHLLQQGSFHYMTYHPAIVRLHVWNAPPQHTLISNQERRKIMSDQTRSRPEKWILVGIPVLFVIGSLMHFAFQLLWENPSSV